jgi:membrane-associated protein
VQTTTFAALATLFLVGLTPVAPTEPLLVGMGVLAATGRLPLLAVIATAAVACSAGDHLLYGAGRTLGGRLTARLRGRPTVRTAQDWLERRITRWGPPALVVGRWLPGGGTVGALLAGTLGWRWTRFTPASMIGSVLWSAYAALVGYAGGGIAGTPLLGLVLGLGLAVFAGLFSSLALRRGGRSAHVAVLPRPDGCLGAVAGADLALHGREMCPHRGE